MRKNLFVIALIFAIPLFAYWFLTNSTATTAKTNDLNKPQVLKFTSQMCLDCQTMNKVFKEIFPKYDGQIILTEIHVQNNDSFNQEQIKKYNVTLVPTIILLDSTGRQVKKIEGEISKETMDKYLMELK